MKILFEKIYTLTVAISKYLIPLYVFHKVIQYGRATSGSSLSITVRCICAYYILSVMFYLLRYCIAQICSRLAPFTIDGDQLIKDYGIEFSKQERDKFVNYTFDDGSGSDGIVTLIAKKGTAFVENVVSSNSNLASELGELGWEITNVSPASPGDLSYIVKFGKEKLYLSEDQLVDFFSYLMARHYVNITDENMIDEEIEKYCTGLGLVPSAR